MGMIPIPIERVDGRIEVVRCRDCKYFELDHWVNVNGQPLIVAHEICNRWGDGRKTGSNGYCHLGEKK